MQMVVVASKPAYKTLHSLPLAQGVKAFLIPRDSTGLIVIAPSLTTPLTFGCGQPQYATRLELTGI